MKHSVIIVAGGKGLRMGSDLPKQFIPINGKPILMHTLGVFHRWNAEAQLILVLPKEHQKYWEMLCRELKCSIPHQIVDGGETRFHSVSNGLKMVSDNALVAIHDGVRPLVTIEVIERCFQKASETMAAIPVVSVIESIRKREGNISYALDREAYCFVQTPQVFQCKRLKEAYSSPYQHTFTDDASVYEAAGGTVTLVEGNIENIKITKPADLEIARIELAKL